MKSTFASRLLAGAVTIAALAGNAAVAAPIENPVAVFSGLDKVTGRIISFDVYIGETVQFGALRVTPRTCQTQPPTEEPNTVVFAEVDEITLDSRIRRIFTGWMFAASPGLNAVEHSVYDVWLKGCTLSTQVTAPPGFERDKYATDRMGLIERPQEWFPLPLPRPVSENRAQ
ncbi:DUF2155 domain-containing protein [Acuticoccus sp.]|uniref:DUF2155 domain-containing protein n=1 Tax=Acuticoccus sp. TaxID=1904378 RepID=UPI003B51D41E